MKNINWQKNKNVIIVTVTLLVIGLLLFVFSGRTNNSDDDNFKNYNPSSKPIARHVVPAPVVLMRAPKKVFFDFGANTGDSLESFVGSVGAAGGSGITGKGKEGAWDLWGFEANPFFNDKLKAMKEKLEAMRLPNGEPQYTVFMRPESAVTTEEGKVTFYLDTVNPHGNYWGSSLRKDHWDVKASGEKAVTVDAYDIAKLLMNYSKEDYIVVKMDIEGSEFDILIHLLNTGAIHWIDELYCEYHTRLEPVPGFSKSMQHVLTKFGIKQGNWD